MVRNGPFPRSKNSHFQNQTKCKTLLWKWVFFSMSIKKHFQINGFALSLALKQRLEATRKRPIIRTTAGTKLTRNPWIVTQESSGKSLRTGTRYCMQPFQCATNNIKLIRFINRMTERVTFRTCKHVQIIRKTNKGKLGSSLSWPKLLSKAWFLYDLYDRWEQKKFSDHSDHMETTFQRS